MGGYIIVHSELGNEEKEYDKESDQRNRQIPSIILLSAKRKDILKVQVDRLLKVLKNKEWKEESIKDIAYTLQVGREPLKERLAVIAFSIKDLICKLENIIYDVVDKEVACIKIGREIYENRMELSNSSDIQRAVRDCIQFGDYDMLVKLWVDGATVLWEELYKDNNKKCKRITLPTYPFEYKQNSKDDCILLTPIWSRDEVQSKKDLVFDRHSVILIEPDFNVTTSEFEAGMHGIDCNILNSQNSELNVRYETYIIEILRKVKEVLLAKQKGVVLFQIVIFTKGDNEVLEGIRGFFKSVNAENPNIVYQMIQVENVIGVKDIIKRLEENSRDTSISDIRYELGNRYVRGLKEIVSGKEEKNERLYMPWKQEGVYLITGGAGDIGLIFAREIMKKVKHAKIILIGRSELSSHKKRKIEEWKENGACIVYWKVDITVKEQVQDLIYRITDKFGQLNGILHAAGIIRDQYISNKTEEEFKEVFKPKTNGLVYLDYCTTQIDLDFIALFSSATAEIGNIGQSDYTAGNGFMDSYAGYRNKKVEQGRCKGKTLSINWPFWESGGMRLSKGLVKLMFDTRGLRPMKTEMGLKVFYEAMAREYSQIIVLQGDNSRIMKGLEKYFLIGGGEDEAQASGDYKDIEPIAIVGVSARFPMARNIRAFWENLKEGKNSITELPKERWSMESYFEEDKEKAFQDRKSYCKWGGFLEDFDKFDPMFFNIPPVEAELIDPQERIFLEECWKAIEDAGYVPSKMKPELKKRIGIYGAITKTGFMLWNEKSNKCYNTSFSSLVNRVSYFMDFSGPSKVVDTMCSSSLVALHEACESIRLGKLEVAVVGGVNLYLHPYNFVHLSQSRMIADSEKSSVFEKNGVGFIPSEGVGAVVLKRLSDAKRDNDSIWAVIRGSAVMHSGRTNGYGVPDPGKIAEVMKNAICDAQVEPETIRHIEAGANGSEMTDTIELAAITKVFGTNNSNRNGYYTISSVKSTLGHGEAVSGFAQLIKAVLQLKYRVICPMKMPKEVTKNIDFKKLPFKVETRLTDWIDFYYKGKIIPRRIGINSLGAGGVYAHAIIEEYRKKEAIEDELTAVKPKLFLFSAKTNDSLDKYLEKWKSFITENLEISIRQISYILQVKRESMKRRFATVARSNEELIQNITDFQNCVENRNNYSEDINTDEYVVPRKREHFPSQHIESCIKEENLAQLAHMWNKHIEIPWELLYKDDIPEHISMLPTYQFKEKSFWVDAEEIISTFEEEDEETIEQDEFISLEENSFVFVEDILSAKTLTNEYQKVNKETKKYVSNIEIQNLIKKLLYEVLYLDDFDEFDANQNFMDLGIDSIYTSEFINKFNERTGLQLRETVIFNYPNTIELAKYAANEINVRG